MSGWPGTYGFLSGVLVTDRPVVTRPGVSTVLEQVGPQLGSVLAAGRVTVAVFDRVPVVEEGTVPVTVYVTELLAAIVAVVSRLPVPLAAPQLLPVPPDAQVQVNPDSADGSASRTAVLTAGAGPALLTTKV